MYIIFRLPAGTSPKLAHLLMGLLQRDAKHRLPFDDFFNHPFLQEERRIPNPISTELASSPKSSNALDKKNSTAGVRLTLEGRTSPCSSPENDFVIVPSDFSSEIDINTNIQQQQIKFTRQCNREIGASPPRPSYLPITEQKSEPRSAAQAFSSKVCSGGNNSGTSGASIVPRSQPINVTKTHNKNQAADIGSLSPPSVQFVIGTPPNRRYMLQYNLLNLIYWFFI